MPQTGWRPPLNAWALRAALLDVVDEAMPDVCFDGRGSFVPCVRRRGNPGRRDTAILQASRRAAISRIGPQKLPCSLSACPNKTIERVVDAGFSYADVLVVTAQMEQGIV